MGKGLSQVLREVLSKARAEPILRGKCADKSEFRGREPLLLEQLSRLLEEVRAILEEKGWILEVPLV